MVLQNPMQNLMNGSIQKNCFTNKAKAESSDDADSFMCMIHEKAATSDVLFPSLEMNEKHRIPDITEAAVAAGFLSASAGGGGNITVVPQALNKVSAASVEGINVSQDSRISIAVPQIIADSDRATQTGSLFTVPELPEKEAINAVRENGGFLQSVELPFHENIAAGSLIQPQSVNEMSVLAENAEQGKSVFPGNAEQSKSVFPGNAEQNIAVPQKDVNRSTMLIPEEEMHYADCQTETESLITQVRQDTETQHEEPLHTGLNNEGIDKETQPDTADHTSDTTDHMTEARQPVETGQTAGQPILFGTETHSVKSTENTGQATLVRTEEFVENTAELLEKAVRSGKKEIEIQLEPEHLGKIIVRTVYDSDKTSVVISCSSEKAMSILSDHAAELGNILQQNMGGETTVVIDDRPQYSWNPDEGGNNPHRQREEQQQKKRNSAQYDGDFLQQLRLGII